MFGNAPKAMWERWITPDAANRIPLHCRSMLVEIDGKLLLCETGIGAFFDPNLAVRYGVVESDHLLLKNLDRRGISPDDISYVILSHLHFDHAGGLLPPWQPGDSSPPVAKKLLFKNARYIVSRSALDRAKKPHPRDRASYISGLPELLEDSNRLIVVDGAHHPEVCPDHVSFYLTNGHTPGHMHSIITTNQNDPQASRVIFTGDLIPGRAWVHLPITMGYDRYAELVIDEKKIFYDHFLTPTSWFFYTHDHEVAMSRIERDNQGKYKAGSSEVILDRFRL